MKTMVASDKDCSAAKGLPVVVFLEAQDHQSNQTPQSHSLSAKVKDDKLTTEEPLKQESAENKAIEDKVCNNKANSPLYLPPHPKSSHLV